jgi:hypothetical protein
MVVIEAESLEGDSDARPILGQASIGEMAVGRNVVNGMRSCCCIHPDANAKHEI